MRVRTTTSLEGLRELRGPYDAAAASCGASPYMSWEWLYHWWAAAGEGYRMHVVTAWDGDGELAGALPLMRVDYGARRLGLRELRLASDVVEASPAYLGIVMRPGREQECVGAMLEHLVGDESWDRVELNRLRARDHTLRWLCQAAAERDLRVELRPRVWSRAAALPESFEAYLGTLSGHRRKRVMYLRRRLARDHAVAFRRCDRPESVERVLEKYLADKCGRMGRKGKWTQFADPRYQRFTRELARALLEKGWLRLWYLEVDGAIGASALGFVTNGVCYLHNYSYDARLESEGISHTLIGHVIEACIEERLSAVDFLFTEYQYKTSYAKSRELVVKVTLYRPGLRSLCYEALAHATAWPLAVRRAWRAGGTG